MWLEAGEMLLTDSPGHIARGIARIITNAARLLKKGTLHPGTRGELH